MKFLADVNIPQSVITTLLSKGHDVLDLKRQNLALKDVYVIKLAENEKRIILTLDKDFIALTQFPKYQIPTIVIRLRNQKPGHVIEKLTSLLENQEEGVLRKSLTIVREEAADSHPY
ncbi:MAG: DUF5615 family PIN-like protein [bacterium]|nr:DUF5615 family PIN-like protein [bacterium]